MSAVELDPASIAKLRGSVQIDRLLDTAVRLIETPSPTRSACACADRLAELLTADGFNVERPVAGWASAPAVAVRLQTGRPGRTLQFNGHLDTVHLPFVPPRVESGTLYGSGAADMKGGIAAMCEALRALRDADALPRGSVLLTAHELHEFPWGDGSQVDGLIAAGYVGDGVLLPEYLSHLLPLVGRGLAVLEAEITRPGVPVHEVLGGLAQPSVIGAGADVIRALADLDARLQTQTDPRAGRASVFVGRAGGGEIFNQSPTRFELAGTRRWLPGTRPADAAREFHDLLADVGERTRTNVQGKFLVVRDAFTIDERDPLVLAFQQAYAAESGAPLPTGAKPFVDDGNAFVAIGRIPAITHGPNATGAHTTNEAAPLAELQRVAVVYALAAVAFA